MSKRTPKTHWNYRVLRTESGGNDYFFITEVHYEKGEPVSYKPFTARHDIGTDDKSYKVALAWTLTHMEEALFKPVLDMDNWPNVFNPSAHDNG